MRALQVIENAYRCNLEEQDDPAVWITHAMRGIGAEVAVLLAGNAVNYAVKSQNASGLSFGDKRQTQPPQLARDVALLLSRGVDVYVVQDDVAERGLESSELLEGLRAISRKGLARLYAEFDPIWVW